MRIGVIDIGGTSLKAGLFSDGTLLTAEERPSNGSQGGPAVLRSVIAALEAQYPFERIGVSTAGQVDPLRGVIRYANPNIPCYTGTDIRGILEAHFHVPVFVENDVNAAAIGEAYYGAAAFQTVKQFLCLTYGTGVGGAMFLNGALYRGAGFAAGAVGHLITHAENMHDFTSPLDGAYEHYASTSALVRGALELDPALKDGRTILANLHRPEIAALVDDWIGEILCGLASLIYTLSPGLVIVGGGIMNNAHVIGQLQGRLRNYLTDNHTDTKLAAAALGNRAGMMGAGYLAARGGETP